MELKQKIDEAFGIFTGELDQVGGYFQRQRMGMQFLIECVGYAQAHVIAAEPLPTVSHQNAVTEQPQAIEPMPMPEAELPRYLRTDPPPSRPPPLTEHQIANKIFPPPIGVQEVTLPPPIPEQPEEDFSPPWAYDEAVRR